MKNRTGEKVKLAKRDYLSVFLGADEPAGYCKMPWNQSTDGVGNYKTFD